MEADVLNFKYPLGTKILYDGLGNEPFEIVQIQIVLGLQESYRQYRIKNSKHDTWVLDWDLEEYGKEIKD